MKVKKLKRARKKLQLYVNVFDFRPPFRVVVDGTFCQAALETKFNIREQFGEYLGAIVEPVTTKCVIDELEALGEDFRGAKLVAKRLVVRKCGHKHGFPADECIAHLIGNKNRHNYSVATQDGDLKAKLRQVAGIPILNLYHNQLNLENPSEASLEFAKQSNVEKVTPKQLKSAKGDSDDHKVPLMKKRKKKGVNPLSVKKKKKKGLTPPAAPAAKSSAE
eukprot:m.22243 g.22243  ORF g.22243 m.22243 type:complete len:220 (-) comp13745_c0_seq1:65-724(-)